MAKYIDVESLRFPNICIFDMTLHGETVPMVRLVDLQKLVPAADVVEVRHGLWIPVKWHTGVEAFGFKEEAVENLRCSVCGKEIDVSEGWAIYCPSCGARMDGGQDDV